MQSSPIVSLNGCALSVPGTGVPLLLRLGKDSQSYSKLRAEEQSSRTPTVRSPPRQASGPGPALCSGEGPVMPHVPEKAAPGADSRGSPDPHAIRTPRRAGNQHFTQEGPEPPRVRGRGHESSTGKLAHPPHLMREAEACSVAAEHGAAFVRLHYWSRITKVHSAAAGAARVVHVCLQAPHQHDRARPRRSEGLRRSVHPCGRDSEIPE